MNLLSQLNERLGRWCCKYIADECPDARVERLHIERLNHLKAASSLRQALRLWQQEHLKSRSREAEAA